MSCGGLTQHASIFRKLKKTSGLCCSRCFCGLKPCCESLESKSTSFSTPMKHILGQQYRGKTLISHFWFVLCVLLFGFNATLFVDFIEQVLNVLFSKVSSLIVVEPHQGWTGNKTVSRSGQGPVVYHHCFP